jgi:ATP-binding cassette subfamily C protein LapB
VIKASPSDNHAERADESENPRWGSAFGLLSGFWETLVKFDQTEIEPAPEAQPSNHSAAACLAPFLKALGYRGTDRDRFEALPHFRSTIDIATLRAALVNLGYVTEFQNAQPTEIDARLMPCLHEAKETSEIIVLLHRTGDEILAFVDGQTRPLTTGEITREGTAYFAKPLKADPAVERISWSQRLIRRFRGFLGQVLVISAISNLLMIAVPLFVMTIYDKVIALRDLDAIPMLLLGITIAIAFDLYLKSLRSHLLGAMAARIDYLISTATFAKLVRLPLSYTDGPPISAQIARLREFQSVRDFFAGPSASAIIDLPFAILTLVAIAAIAGWLVLAPILMCLVFAVVGFASTKWLQVYERAHSVASTALFQLITDTTLHHEAIKREGGENVWQHRYRLKSAAAANGASDLQARSAAMEALSQFLNNAAALAILVAGTLMVVSGEITVGALIATMALTWRILSPAQQLIQTLARLDRLRSSILSMDQMLRVTDEYDAATPNLARPPKAGRIAFNRVTLRYVKDADPAIVNANLVVPPGKMIALTGPSGSGKSSILRLVQGLYRPQGGVVTIDSTDIRQIPPKVLRRAIACAPQKIDLFYGTIAQNLRLAEPLAGDDDLRAATDQVGILDSILDLPLGFDTRIGDSSTNRLPPGFLRQLAIARALVRKTPILLLDEPESMLDDQGAIAVGRALERLRGTRTILFVSHRPSYIKLADYGVFIRGGAIEYGGKPEGAIEKMLGQAKTGIAA